MSKFKKYLLLFFDFFKIGLFTFGGGYAMISLLSSELVEKRKYVSSEEFSDIVAIAESTPGPVAINSATYIGFRVGGVLGSILSSIAVSLPSFIIIYLISIFLPHFMDNAYVLKAFKGVQCAVVVLVVSASFKLFKAVKKSVLSYILIALSAILLIVFDLLSVDISTIYFIVIGGLIGFAFYYPKAVKEAKIALEKKAGNGSANSTASELENQEKPTDKSINDEKEGEQ